MYISGEGKGREARRGRGREEIDLEKREIKGATETSNAVGGKMWEEGGLPVTNMPDPAQPKRAILEECLVGVEAVTETLEVLNVQWCAQ